MKKIRIWIVFALFQLASVALVWILSSPDQRAQYQAWFGIEPPQEKIKKRKSLNIRAVSRVGNDRANQTYSARREIDQPYECSPKTRPITSVKKNGVFKWVDEQGKTHYSDKAPVNHQAENLTQRYSEKNQYFTISVQNQGAFLPAYMKDHLSTDTRQIFNILSHQLKLSDLRQVDLKVHVFDHKGVFKRFQQQIALGLGDNIAGFYSSGLNLVAVMRQQNDEATFATARHEAAHVIIAGLLGNIPTWFTEGLAEYFEQMTISGQLKTIAPNQGWLNLLQSQQRSKRLMSLNQYFQYDRQTWRNQNQDTMYAMAWSLTYYLMSSEHGQNLLNRFMRELSFDRCQTINSREFFARNYRGGLQKLNKDWQRWLTYGQHSSHRF
ncbi:hypothetical protein ACH42_00550 [Endozoicomonas sp. (ex Bugula neritina AB1)]|nr:hypothetical protein ACH42_00550 [Endozoicomonas sp. (ex Bugula neritina AB1)]